MKKNFLVFFGLLLMLTAWGSAATPAQQMFFPYVVNDAQTQTELVFTNASRFDGNVKLSVYKTTGELVSSAATSVQVPANSQLSIKAETLGIAAGWVIAESDLSSLIGNLHVESSIGTGAEIAAPAFLSKQVVFPFVASGPQMSTDIAVANPNVYATRGVFNLYNTGGSLLYTANVVIPAYGVWQGPLTALFGGDKDLSAASHMVVQSQPLNIFRSEVSIVGFEVVRGFSAISGSPYDIPARKDLAAMAAIPSAGLGNNLIFPHVVLSKAPAVVQPGSMKWFSLLGVVNLSNSSQTVTFNFHDDEGASIPAASKSIPANGSLRMTAGELFGISDDGAHLGWVEVSAGGSLAAFQGMGTFTGTSLGVASAQSAGITEFVLPGLNTTGNNFSSYVLMNAGTNPVDAVLFVMSPAGVTNGSIPIRVDAQKRKVGLIQNSTINQAGGYIYVQASAPLYSQGFLGSGETLLSQLSPESNPGYTPPVNATPQQATISQLTVVTTDQSDQKSAGNNPDAYVIFGTYEVSLKIEGDKFIFPGQNRNPWNLYLRDASGQVLLFIPAEDLNVVDSKTIFAHLKLGGLFAPILPVGRYEIFLRGEAPLDSLQTNALPFYILPPLPVVTSVLSSSGTASTYARYEIDSPGETLRIYGYGFRPGVRVLFNGNTALNGLEIDTTYVGPTYLTAFLPPQALRFGGVYLIRVRNASELPEASGEAVNFQINNLRPQIVSLDPPSPINIIGPGPGPVTIDLTVNGNNFHPSGDRDPGTVVAVTNIEPDIFPAIVPVGGPTQCIRTNGRTVLRVRVYDVNGLPAAGVSVTFTAPELVTTEATGSFLGGASTITLVTDQNGFAPGLDVANPPLFTANPFAGSYAVKVEATVSGFPLLAVFNITNLNFGDTCSAGTGEVNFVSSHQIIVANLPIPNRGKYSVVVANAAPGGGYSNEYEFTVGAGPTSSVPQLVSLSPTSVAAGSGDFVLTANGSGLSFKTGAWINFGTVMLKTTFVNGNTLTATVPALLISSPGIVPVTVTNPGDTADTGGTSSRQLFLVQ